MFMTTVYAHICRTSILTLYQQPSCFMFIIANDLSKNHDRKRLSIFSRLQAFFFCPLGGRDGLPCGKPLRSDIVQYVICVGTTRKGRPFPGL